MLLSHHATQTLIPSYPLHPSQLGKLIASVTLLVVIVSSCRESNLGLQERWDSYHNPRYGFEFPYPSHWVPFPVPDNRDGQAFRNSQNSSVEIRGWAAHKLPNIEVVSPHRTPPESPKAQQQNFTTKQGVMGKLQVDIGFDTSLMTLTLIQGKVVYNWQGQCDSKQFADYYRFFSYVASQYRLPPPEEP